MARGAAEPVDADELEAVELARRVAASDLGSETLTRLETTVEDLATAYPVTAPDELLDRVRTHLGYVSRLTDIRATLALLTTDHLDEATASALAAMQSGMLVPSNHWRALEVVRATEPEDYRKPTIYAMPTNTCASRPDSPGPGCTTGRDSKCPSFEPQ